MAHSISREALLDRLRRVDARLVAMIAPAGFGKSTFARQYLAARGGGVICDCSGVRDELDLARRLFPNLAALEDGGTSVADRVDAALKAWQEPAPSCAVFESVERIEEPAAWEMLARMLELRPPGRSIVVCSRRPLRLQLSRYAVPHEIVTLRAGDLALDRGDVRAIFQPFALEEGDVERIVTLTEGWPVAVLLLQRFASERRLHQLLEHLDDVAFDELRDYLANEVLAGIDGPTREAVFACAAMPQATLEDLRLALEDESALQRLDAFARDTSFVRRDERAAYVVHPILTSLILAGAAERRDALRARVARAHEERGAHLRAAELHLAHGDQPAAARALANEEIIHEPALSVRYSQVLACLDHALVTRYPRLWGVTALMLMFRMPAAVLLDETESVWRTIARSASAQERYYVFAPRVLLMGYLGMFSQALTQVEAFRREIGASDPPQSKLDGHLIFLRGLLYAGSGALTQGERDLNAALPLVEEMHLAVAATYMALGAYIARPRGEWSLERQFLARAQQFAAQSMLPNVGALVTAESLFGAWLTGDSGAFHTLAAELEGLVAAGAVGFAYVAASARGRDTEPTSADLPQFVLVGRLMALSRSRDDVERAMLARDAAFAVDGREAPFLEALASVALALCDSASAAESIARAKAAAARCESPALASAVDAVAGGAGFAGILTSFVAQIEREQSDAAPVMLEILRGRVRIDGIEVPLGGREFELLAAIAQRREATPRHRLASMLWPDLSETAGRNALGVSLHRLRGRFARADAIERDAEGYRLHANAFVDLWEIERTAERVRTRERLREGDRAALVRTWERLREERYAPLERWEWFEPALQRLDELRTVIAHRLGIDALDGDPQAALAYALDVIGFDPYDEPARELAITAHLALGDRSAALRVFRQYRDALRRDLQAEPSPALAALVYAT